MALTPRLLFPLCSALLVPVACSSSEEPNKVIPGPPGAGNKSTGGAGGSAGAMATGGESSGSGGGGGGSTCAKAADCPTNGFCQTKTGMCTCPMDKLDICPSTGAGGGAAANPKGACVSKMTDPENCGACGMQCEPGAACVEGACGDPPMELGKSTGCGSMRMVIQGANLYWTETMTGKVMSMPVAGGAAVEVATAQASPTQITADAKGVYWVNQGTGAGTSNLMKKPLPTGAAVELAKSATADKLLAVAVANNKVYYSLVHDVHAVSNDEAVETDDIVGSAINFDINPPTGEPSGEPAGLVVTDTMVYWTTATRQGVEGGDIAAGLTGYVELGESQGSLLLPDLAAQGMYVYWANGEQFVRAVNTTKGNVPITKPPLFDAITAFSINATDVYFAAEKGQVLKHSLMPAADPNDETTAVPPVAIARDQLSVTSLILDATKVYWASDCVIRSTGL